MPKREPEPETGDAENAAGEADADGSPAVDWDDMLEKLTAQPPEAGWVTLDEASNAAGLARSTLRSWYRSDQIPSRMIMGPHGPQRMVPLDAVIDRALRSSRLRRQLEQGRSLAAEVERLRQRVEVMERMLGLR